MAQRPTFLSIICILLALLGLLLLAAGALLVSVENMAFFKDALAEAGVDEFGGIFTATGAVMIITGLLAIVMVIFLWKGSKIGWFLAVIFLILCLINAIMAFLSVGSLGLVTLLIVIFFLWYFMKPNVREFFGV
ncbi:MAG: hypothetical protein LBE47_03470 [Methanomassiliicoccaceae archaeon]|jgi:hypothetical protein|nr:hypothetical protein [Methanomassiliicoccaceae archaeon]